MSSVILNLLILLVYLVMCINVTYTNKFRKKYIRRFLIFSIFKYLITKSVKLTIDVYL